MRSRDPLGDRYPVAATRARKRENLRPCPLIAPELPTSTGVRPGEPGRPGPRLQQRGRLLEHAGAGVLSQHRRPWPVSGGVEQPGVADPGRVPRSPAGNSRSPSARWSGVTGEPVEQARAALAADSARTRSSRGGGSSSFSGHAPWFHCAGRHPGPPERIRARSKRRSVAAGVFA
ncbi:hypothetical protein UO65_1902 [Actinokineospora spheciospongiae]|uniref:Uncharacterized protein n=1 Tax=Actinokineospora spheciospongiae TaxID=909613 RepID=W7IPH9_9PSEU|nr:hypothetical protein UO65_1902 [Actinokineospora spheciospongiae]